MSAAVVARGAITVALAAVGLTVGGAKFIEFKEGRTLVPYRDIVGVLTNCVGNTGAGVNQALTDDQCDAMYTNALVAHTRELIKCVPNWYALTDGQRVAFASLAYNVGPPLVCKGSIPRLVARGDLKGACAKLSEYVWAGGKKSQGLINRRADERAVCEGRKDVG